MPVVFVHFNTVISDTCNILLCTYEVIYYPFANLNIMYVTGFFLNFLLIFAFLPCALLKMFKLVIFLL